MRVLVTRPEPAATATAERLRALGHAPILSPVTRIVASDTPVPDLPFALGIVTSAAALTHGGALPAPLTRLPLIAVGEATARAARAAGFAGITTGAGHAGAIPALVAARAGPDQGPLLYLAGTPRKTDIERQLTGMGYRLTVIERYRALPADELTPEAATALRTGTIDAALHYSHQSALRFAGLCAAAGLAAAAQAILHVCLSDDVAAGLAALQPVRLAIAKAPDEAALIGQLDK